MYLDSAKVLQDGGCGFITFSLYGYYVLKNEGERVMSSYIFGKEQWWKLVAPSFFFSWMEFFYLNGFLSDIGKNSFFWKIIVFCDNGVLNGVICLSTVRQIDK